MSNAIPSSVLDRLFLRVEIPQDAELCWLWTGAKSRFGHGRIKVDGKLKSPHRIICEVYHGPLAEGGMACHTCDNPSCVNPKHIFKGTHSDNMKDCAAKGRMHSQSHPEYTQGERHAGAKLNDQAVREIRRSAGIVGVRQLAKQFGVHKSIIQKVIKRQRWAHVPDDGLLFSLGR